MKASPSLVTLITTTIKKGLNNGKDLTVISEDAYTRETHSSILWIMLESSGKLTNMIGRYSC